MIPKQSLPQMHATCHVMLSHHESAAFAIFGILLFANENSLITHSTAYNNGPEVAWSKMTSPTTTKTAPFASRLRGFINGIKRTVSRNEFSEGSSRRGRTLSDAVRPSESRPLQLAGFSSRAWFVCRMICHMVKSLRLGQ